MPKDIRIVTFDNTNDFLFASIREMIFTLVLAIVLVLSSLHLSYSYMHQDKVLEQGLVSQYALEYLRHKLVARTQRNLWRQLTLTLNARWQDRQGTYTDFKGHVNDYRPYTLVDARMQWTAPRYTLYVEANNLLDNRSYVDYGNVPQPGLWLVGGIKLSVGRL